jgi:TP901 family phage tail tape measure protein
MADLGSMIVHLSVDTSGIMTAKVELQKFGKEAQYSLTKANTQMSLLSAKTQKLANNISNISQKTRTFGYLTSAVVTAPIVAFGKSAITAAKDYEFAMAKIEGLAGIPETLVKEWNDAILKLAPAIGQAPQEMADALYFVSSAGFKGAEALDITAMASKAAATGMGKAADIADLLVSAMNAYKTSGLDAARAMDIFTAAVREGKIEPDAFVRSLGPVISIAAELGVGLEEVTAGMAAMSLSGASAANTATFMRNIFMKLARPAKQVEEALNGMKTSSVELRRMLGEQGLMPTLEYLRKLTEQYGESIFDIFPEMRGLIGVLKLVGENLEYNKKVFESVANSTGDFALAFEVASSTMQVKFAKASAMTKVAMIQLGQIIGAYVLPVVEGLARTIKNLSDWLAGLNNAWRKVVLGVTAFFVAMGPVTLILSVLGYIVGGVVVAIGYLKGAYLKLTGATVAATTAQTAYNASVAASVGAQVAYTSTTTAAAGATATFGNAAKVAGISVRSMFGIIGLVAGALFTIIHAIRKHSEKNREFQNTIKDLNVHLNEEVYSLDNVLLL